MLKKLEFGSGSCVWESLYHEKPNVQALSGKSLFTFQRQATSKIFKNIGRPGTGLKQARGRPRSRWKNWIFFILIKIFFPSVWMSNRLQKFVFDIFLDTHSSRFVIWHIFRHTLFKVYSIALETYEKSKSKMVVEESGL